MDDDLPEFLRAVGEQLRSVSAQYVRAGGRGATTWTDGFVLGEDNPTALFAQVGQDWLRTRAGGEVSAVRFADGWWIMTAAVGAPTLPLDGALVVAREAASPLTDGERDEVTLSARLLSSLAASGPLVSDNEWRASGHRATVGLSALSRDLDFGPNGELSAYAIRLERLRPIVEVMGAQAVSTAVDEARRRVVEWVGDERRVLQLAGADFLVLRSDVASESEAVHEAERLRAQLAAPIDLGMARVSRSASIGVACTSGRAQAPAVLLAAALQAMREAQEAGGDVVRTPGQERDNELASLRLESELLSAVRDNALRLVYQPEFDLRTGELLAVEALLRWQHPERGLLVPDEFIGLAESSHALGDMGAWVVRESFRQLSQWMSEFPRSRFMLRLNVAASQLADTALADLIVAQLGQYGLRGQQICIEITERLVPSSLTTVAEVLTSLRKIGVSAAIDDFGTGQSSLSHLRELSVDTLKLDRSFVSDVVGDPRSRAIVGSLIELAHGLGMNVVAEGVESHETAAELIRMGCTRAQGNLLGAAMGAESIRGLLQVDSARGRR